MQPPEQTREAARKKEEEDKKAAEEAQAADQVAAQAAAVGQAATAPLEEQDPADQQDPSSPSNDSANPNERNQNSQNNSENSRAQDSSGSPINEHSAGSSSSGNATNTNPAYTASTPSTSNSATSSATTYYPPQELSTRKSEYKQPGFFRKLFNVGNDGIMGMIKDLFQAKYLRKRFENNKLLLAGLLPINTLFAGLASAVLIGVGAVTAGILKGAYDVFDGITSIGAELVVCATGTPATSPFERPHSTKIKSAGEILLKGLAKFIVGSAIVAGISMGGAGIAGVGVAAMVPVLTTIGKVISLGTLSFSSYIAGGLLAWGFNKATKRKKEEKVASEERSSSEKEIIINTTTDRSKLTDKPKSTAEDYNNAKSANRSSIYIAQDAQNNNLAAYSDLRNKGYAKRFSGISKFFRKFKLSKPKEEEPKFSDIPPKSTLSTPTQGGSPTSTLSDSTTKKGSPASQQRPISHR